jgi:DNA replication and repair protein RecF
VADGQPWRVLSLEISDLRCWERLELELPGGLVVFCGPNGAGKTSIIEAIVLATLGVSPRTAQLGDLVRTGAPAVRVAGTFADPTIPGIVVRREIGYAVGIGRRLSLDGVGVRQLMAWRRPGAVLVFVPEELRAVKGPPAARRRSLDRLLEAITPGFPDDLSGYQDALSQRNALLRRARAGSADIRTAFPWEARMATLGARVASARRAALAALAPRYAYWLERLGGGTLGRLAWEPSPATLAETADDQLEDHLRAHFEQLRHRDLAAGLTTTGLHRDDVWIGSGTRDLRRLGSQGEQRTAALALLLAHRDQMRTTGAGPILLLDDVLSELDPERRAALLGALDGNEQVILTSAEPETAIPATSREATIIRVVDGACAT